MNPVVHFEMPYQDATRVMKFYRTVFGWGKRFFPESTPPTALQLLETRTIDKGVVLLRYGV